MARMSFEDMTKDLMITDINISENFIDISWAAPNCGFGHYTIQKDEDGSIHADSEHMDSREDKRFLQLLLNKIYEMTVVDY